MCEMPPCLGPLGSLQRKGMKEHQGLHGHGEQAGACRAWGHQCVTAASPAALLMGMRIHHE